MIRQDANENTSKEETAEQKARRFMDVEVDNYIRQYVNYLHTSAEHPAPLREVMIMKLAEIIRGGEKKQEEVVNRPSHYTSHPSGVECVKIAEHLSFNLGNALKYVWRAGLKGEGTRLVDVKKALWYTEEEALVCQQFGSDHALVQKGVEGHVDCLAMKVIEAAPATLSGLVLQSVVHARKSSEMFREISAILKMSIACLESETGKDAQAKLVELLSQGLNAQERRS